jgi:hypothetical protein
MHQHYIKENSIDPSSESASWKSSPDPRQSDDASSPSVGADGRRCTGSSLNRAQAALSGWSRYIICCFRSITCCFRCSTLAALDVSSASRQTLWDQKSGDNIPFFFTRISAHRTYSVFVSSLRCSSPHTLHQLHPISTSPILEVPHWLMSFFSLTMLSASWKRFF